MLQLYRTSADSVARFPDHTVFQILIGNCSDLLGKYQI